MKTTFAALLGLLLFTSQVDAQQKKQSGAIQFQSTFDPAAMAAANGIKLSEEMMARMPKSSTTDFELLFNATNASYTVWRKLKTATQAVVEVAACASADSVAQVMICILTSWIIK